MPLLKQLSQKLQDAIRRKRAIPLLVDYRMPEMPTYALSVYGFIDDRSFEGTFRADDDADDDKLMRVPLPTCQECSVSEVRVESDDADAVHEIWSRWHSGERDNYLRFMQFAVSILSEAKLKEAIQRATPVSAAREEAAENTSVGKSKRSTSPKARPPKSKTQKSTPR